MASREYFDETPRKDNLNSAYEGLSASERAALCDECARTALALTALFDGAASIEEALLARTHLAECIQCEVVWQGWKQQTSLLRQIAAPVPPGLLTRLLTAIRLLSLMPNVRARVETKTAHWEPKSTLVHDARLLSDVVLLAGANPFAPRRNVRRGGPKIEAPRELPPLDPLSPLPPSNLRDDILRCTVGMAKATQSSEIADCELHEPQLIALSTSRSRRSLQLSSSLMPVLAAWLIFLSGPSKLWAPLMQPDAALSARRHVAPKISAAKFGSKLEPKLVRRNLAFAGNHAPAENEAVESKNAVADIASSASKANPVEPEHLEKPAGIEQKPAAPVIESGATSTDLLAVNSPQAAVVVQPVTSRKALIEVPAKAEMPSSRPVLTSGALPKVTPAAHYSPATTTADIEIRTRRSSWNAPEGDTPATSRSSWVEVANSHVAAPQPVNSSDNADSETDAETLEHVNSLSDERPEDVRSVLDDYRASLLSENADEDVANITG